MDRGMAPKTSVFGQRSHRGCDLVDSDTCNAGGRGDFGQIRGPSGANILALYGVHCWVFLFTPPPVHLGTRAKYVDNLLLWNARPPQLWTPDYVKQRIPRKSCRRTRKQHRCDLRSLCWNFQFHWFAAVGIVILDLVDPSVKFSSSPKAMTAFKWRISTLANTAPPLVRNLVKSGVSSCHLCLKRRVVMSLEPERV